MVKDLNRPFGVVGLVKLIMADDPVGRLCEYFDIRDRTYVLAPRLQFLNGTVELGQLLTNDSRFRFGCRLSDRNGVEIDGEQASSNDGKTEHASDFLKGIQENSYCCCCCCCWETTSLATNPAAL